MKCPKCGQEMDLEDKDTSSGSDMRTYRCHRCQESHIVDCGTALWKVLSEARKSEDD
jgi:transposase-like protein